MARCYRQQPIFACATGRSSAISIDLVNWVATDEVERHSAALADRPAERVTVRIPIPAFSSYFIRVAFR